MSEGHHFHTCTAGNCAAQSKGKEMSSRRKLPGGAKRLKWCSAANRGSSRFDPVVEMLEVEPSFHLFRLARLIGDR